jgi:hypothetical protein
MYVFKKIFLLVVLVGVLVAAFTACDGDDNRLSGTWEVRVPAVERDVPTTISFSGNRFTATVGWVESRNEAVEYQEEFVYQEDMPMIDDMEALPAEYSIFSIYARWLQGQMIRMNRLNFDSVTREFVSESREEFAARTTVRTTGGWSKGTTRGTNITRTYRASITGTYSITDDKIELVFSDGHIEVLDFSRTENTITIDGDRFTRE